MAFRYKLQFTTQNKQFSIFDLEKEHILSGSTCYALYHQKAVQTVTLEKIMDSTDCSLDDLLCCQNKTAGRNPMQPDGKRSLDLDDMVRRQVISRTAKRYFLANRPMSLSTLDLIAEDQGVSLLDFMKVDAQVVRDSQGNLKNSKKVLYLTEW